MNASTIDRLDWARIATELDTEGYAVLCGLFTTDLAGELAGQIDALRRVSLASEELGRGNLFFFGERLPTSLQHLRAELYRPLAAIANGWNDTLNVEYRYPGDFDEFEHRHRVVGQRRQLSYLSRLGEDDYLALHQRDDGDHVFPFQLVGLLSSPVGDFSGGEFVMTEQRPRMQSRPMVLPLAAGDAAIISTAQRPHKGTKGYYRVNLKHAVSRVRTGSRLGIELSFHNGPEAQG